jgi:hypothetical protein
VDLRGAASRLAASFLLAAKNRRRRCRALIAGLERASNWDSAYRLEDRAVEIAP